jgi:hypothetical protein
MSERETAMFEHRERSLERPSEGEFALTAEGLEEIRLRPEKEGWVVEGAGDLGGWRLRRGSPVSGGFILTSAEGKSEAGRTTALAGSGRDADLRYLLTSDGRLYRIQLCGPRDGRFELSSWETPGAYLTARPEARGWRISPDPASAGLEEIRPLLILFAAEILDSEEALVAG